MNIPDTTPEKNKGQYKSHSQEQSIRQIHTEDCILNVTYSCCKCT